MFDTVTYKHYVLTIRGDSVINDTLYKKLIIRNYFFGGRDELDATPPYRISANSRLYALLRDDTTQEKLYGRVPTILFDGSSPLTVDTLVHDYSAVANDSVSGYYFSSPMKVDSVTDRLVFGTVRKTQIHRNGGPLNEFFEGIGMIRGGPLTYFDTMRLAQGEPIVIDYCIGTDAECQLDQKPSMFSPGYVWNHAAGYPWFSPSTVRRYRISQEPTVLDGDRYYQVETSTVEPNDLLWLPLDDVFLREDKGKVYVHAPASEEDTNLETDILLYDFTLAVGDTFAVPKFSPLNFGGNSSSVAIVTAVDSVTLANGERRKRLALGCRSPGNRPPLNQYYWIEGMGSTSGMFESTFICTADAFGPQLLCYSLNGETLYSNFPSCEESPVSTKRMGRSEDKLHIHPNPTSGTLIIDRVTAPFKLLVYDLMGRSVRYHLNVTGNEIDLSPLPSGVYFLEVTEMSGSRSVARVVRR